MSPHVESQLPVDTAGCGELFQPFVQLRISVHGKQLAVLRRIPIFVDDMQRQVERRYLERHARFLPCCLAPDRSILGCFKIFDGQTARTYHRS